MTSDFKNVSGNEYFLSKDHVIQPGHTLTLDDSVVLSTPEVFTNLHWGIDGGVIVATSTIDFDDWASAGLSEPRDATLVLGEAVGLDRLAPGVGPRFVITGGRGRSFGR